MIRCRALNYNFCKLILFSFITARKRRLGHGNVFTPVCDSVHGECGVSAPLHTEIHTPLGRHPPNRSGTLPRQTPLAPGRHCPRQTPPFGYYRIWSTGGWYASYWNAYLFHIIFTMTNEKIIPLIFRTCLCSLWPKFSSTAGLDSCSYQLKITINFMVNHFFEKAQIRWTS